MLTRPLPMSSSLLGYFRRTRAELSAAAFKLAFAMLVISTAFGVTYADSKVLFSRSDLIGILVHGAVFSSVPLLAVLTALRSQVVANSALALVTIGCVFTAYLAHTELFYPENRAALIGVCAVAAFALFVAFSIVDERRWGGALLSAAALAAIAVLVGSALTRDDNVGTEPRTWSDAGSNIRSIKFQETPNVYFVGFESLVPRSVMQKYIGIESTDAHELFDTEMRRFRNLFTNAFPTKNSLGIIYLYTQSS